MMMIGLFEDAISSCLAATAINPDYSPAHLRRARALLRLGDLAAAHEAVLEALSAMRVAARGSSLAVDDPAAGALLKRVNAQQAAEARAEELLSARAYAAAQAALAGAVGLNPPREWSWSATLLNARALIGLGRFEDVERTLAPLLPVCLSGGCSLRGAPRARSGLPFPEALLASALLRCEALYRTGDIKEALARLAELVRIPSSLGSDALAAAERLRSALATFDARCTRGNDLFRSASYATAAAEYDALLKSVLASQEAQSPRFCANVASNRAAALMATCDYVAAAAECSRALAWHPAHVKARLRRARAHTEAHDFPAAKADFDAVLAAMRDGQPGAGPGGRSDVKASDVAAELAEAERAAKRRAKEEREARERAERAEREAREARERAARERAARDHGHRSGGRGGASSFPFHDDGSDDDFSARFGGASWGFGGSGSANRPAGGVRAPPPPPPAQPPDHYGVLGLPVTAAVADVRRAYRALSLRVHPDKHGGCAVAAERFKAVAAAHETLADPVARREHDDAVRDFQRRWPGRWVPAKEGEVPGATPAAPATSGPGAPQPAAPAASSRGGRRK